MRRWLFAAVVAVAVGLGGGAVAEVLVPGFHDEFGPGACGRGFDARANLQGSALVFFWAEGTDWQAPQPERHAWVSLWNPREQDQTVLLTTWDELGVETGRRVILGAQRRGAVELRQLFGWRSTHNFSLRVQCASSCVATLVTWDGGYTTPAYVPGLTGCYTNDFTEPYSGVLVPWYKD